MTKITRHVPTEPSFGTSAIAEDQHPDAANPLVRIRSLLPRLARTEQRVANVVLNDPGMVVRANIARVASIADTSETTVIRFAKAAGFADFQQLQYALISGISERIAKPLGDDEHSLEASTPEQNFATNVKRRRELLNLSQETVAEKMQERGHSFHQATVYKIETGARRVQLSEAVDLAAVLDSDVPEMMRLPEEARERDYVFEESSRFGDATRQLVKAIKAYDERRAQLNITLDRYEDTGIDAIPQGIIEEMREDANRSVTSLVEFFELRSHILDEGDERMALPPEPEGELTYEQKIQIARWEVERAEFLALATNDRLDWAREYLATLESRLESVVVPGPHPPREV